MSVFSPAGRFFTEFGLQPDPAQAGEDLEFPQGVAAGVKGQIWVADSGHDRISSSAGAGTLPRRRAVIPGGPSRPLIIGAGLLALLIAGLGWY